MRRPSEPGIPALAIVLVAAAFLPSCQGKTALVIVDPYFQLADPAMDRALSGMRPRGLSASVERLNPGDGGQRILDILDAREEEVLVLSPLLSRRALAVRTARPDLPLVLAGSDALLPPGPSVSVALRRVKAYAEAGRVAGRFATAYSAGNPDLPVTALILAEDAQRPAACADAFIAAFLAEAPGHPLIDKRLDPKRALAEAEAVLQELLGKNVRMALVAAGSASSLVASRLSQAGAAIMSDSARIPLEAQAAISFPEDEMASMLEKAVEMAMGAAHSPGSASLGSPPALPEAAVQTSTLILEARFSFLPEAVLPGDISPGQLSSQIPVEEGKSAPKRDGTADN